MGLEVKLINMSFIRSSLWAGFFFLILLSWYYLYSMSSMMGLDWFGQSERSMSMGSTVTFKTLFPMWSIMMIAMMFPAMVPTLKGYQDLIKSANGSWLGWLGVLLGYFIIWVLFSLIISTIQSFLTEIKILTDLGLLKSKWMISLVLIVVGIFQFTVLKDYCHGVCHSPMAYFLTKWRQGFFGGLRMGLGLGLFCVGCCWGFMLLGFTVGYMNFVWMGLITLVVVIEKLPQVGVLVKKPLGSVLIILGIGLALINFN